MMKHLLTPPAERTRLWLALLPAMVLPFFASLIYFVLLPGGRLAQVLYFLTKVFTVAWPAAVWLLIEKRQPPSGERSRRSRSSALLWGAASGLLIFAVIVIAFHATVVGDYVRRHQSAILEKVRSLELDSPVTYLAFAGFLAVLHSLIEEYYWRWFVFGRLTRVLPFALACPLAALAFAAHHYVVLSAFFSPAGVIGFGTAVAVGGALWCWLYHRHRTLIGCWLSHVLVDAAVLYAGYRLVFGA